MTSSIWPSMLWVTGLNRTSGLEGLRYHTFFRKWRNGGIFTRKPTLLINLRKEIYDIVVDGGVDGLVGWSLLVSSDWLWTCLWPMQSVRSWVPANVELSTCAGANGDRAAARTAGHHWSQEGNTQDILVLTWTPPAKWEDTPQLLHRVVTIVVHTERWQTNRRTTQHKPKNFSLRRALYIELSIDKTSNAEFPST